jgi:hypothetical protein
MTGRIVRWAALMLGVVVFHPAMAAPPPGTDLSSSEHLWWECQRTPGARGNCCAEADGHNLNDGEWRQSGSGYQVRVGGYWFDVPSEAVITGAGRCGPEPDAEHRSEAKVWYVRLFAWGQPGFSVLVRCFIAGTLY